MNKSERSTLAQFAANLIYGLNADHERASIGYRLLNSFPSAKSQFVFAAEVEAEERIGHALIAAVTDRVRLDTINERSKLHASLVAIRESIIALVETYCAHAEVKATTMVDDGHDMVKLYRSSAFRQVAQDQVKHDPDLQPFLDAMGDA